MSQIVIVEGNNIQVNIDTVIEANVFRKMRLYQLLTTTNEESRENDKILKFLMENILFLKQSDAVVSLEEYKYLINQLKRLTKSKKDYRIKIDEIMNGISLIIDENEKLAQQRLKAETKILFFPSKRKGIE